MELAPHVRSLRLQKMCLYVVYRSAVGLIVCFARHFRSLWSGVVSSCRNEGTMVYPF